MWMSNLKKVLTPLLQRAMDLLQAMQWVRLRSDWSQFAQSMVYRSLVLCLMDQSWKKLDTRLFENQESEKLWFIYCSETDGNSYGLPGLSQIWKTKHLYTRLVSWKWNVYSPDMCQEKKCFNVRWVSRKERTDFMRQANLYMWWVCFSGVAPERFDKKKTFMHPKGVKTKSYCLMKKQTNNLCMFEQECIIWAPEIAAFTYFSKHVANYWEYVSWLSLLFSVKTWGVIVQSLSASDFTGRKCRTWLVSTVQDAKLYHKLYACANLGLSYAKVCVANMELC